MPAQPPRTSLPTVEDTRGLLAKLREFALVGAGLAANNRLDAFVRLRDLKDAGIINVREGFVAGGPGGSGSTGPGGRPVVVEPAVDLTPPPVPGGFQATAGVTQILFETAAPIYRQGHGHARTKVYAAPHADPDPLPTFADAVLYTDFPGNVGVAPFDPASNLRLWATWTSVDGKESEPAGGTNGVEATTGLLEDQHIANLTVGKLLAGSLAVGEYIQSADYVANTSGWRIQTLSGGGAFLEINGGAYIGGLVVGPTYIQSANYSADVEGYRFNSDGTGQIGGFEVGNTYIQSTNYVVDTSGWRLDQDGNFYLNNLSARGALMGGDFAGYAWPASGGTGFYLGPSGLLLGNANDGSYFQVDAAGNVYAPGFNIVAGAATFGGALSAASGTFAGTLTAQVVETANIVGAAVSSTSASSSETAPSVTVSAPAGSSMLVVMVYPGLSLDSGSGGAEGGETGVARDWADLVVNGTNVIPATYSSGLGTKLQGMFIYTIDSPSGSYTITANRYQTYGTSHAKAQLVVILSKR